MAAEWEGTVRVATACMLNVCIAESELKLATMICEPDDSHYMYMVL